MSNALLDKINDKSAKVGIIGLGYVGLPLIRAFVNAGFTCLGYDVDQAKVEALEKGESYIAQISQWIADWHAKGQFEATADMSRLNEAG
jgi:UDP-N-acetyl-D-glucosamine dehydrogenase